MNTTLERIKQLTETIRGYDEAYYNRGESLVSDAEYDRLYAELVELERKHPKLAAADSPTHRVGNDLKKSFQKLEHSIPMLSIDNTYSSQELIAWIERVHKQCGTTCSFVGELKIDGVAAALRYDNGRLAVAITRGNGLVGDEITTNVKTINDVPQTVRYDQPFELRGEIYMTFAHFADLNQRLTEAGAEPLQNPRNTTAGTIKLLDPEAVRSRNLSFVAHYLISQSHQCSHLENLQFMQHLSVPVVEHSDLLHTADEVMALCDLWENKRHSLPFPIDGIVIKVNEIECQKALAATAKSIRWAIAYKYEPQRAQTEIIAIDSQVGRTGVVTPVARLTPTLLSGTTVRNATLHNFDEISRLNVNVGSIVLVEKSGEIIPKITGVVSAGNRASPHPFQAPTACPSCGEALVRLDEEVAIRCINTRCPAQMFAALVHFVSRDAMNIDGMGPALLEQLIEKKLISSIADLYRLTAQQLIELDRMGEKSAGNILASLEKSKSNPLHRLIFGLGIRMVGLQSAKVLAGALSAISDLFEMDIETLTALESIGPVVAGSVHTYFRQEKNRALIRELEGLGLNCVAEKPRTSLQERPLQGRTFVVTGTLEHFSRQEAHAAIEKLGGKTASAVSKNTSAIIVGTEAGSKLTKATALSIPILDERQFEELLAHPDTFQFPLNRLSRNADRAENLTT
ncbi:MAG: NAD-dependent DNA ligase LigA [Chitinivibrionales bacterium]|nr:NAD-dependent DNA ligase LigA [Chitinivibrionales bacterium]